MVLSHFGIMDVHAAELFAMGSRAISFLTIDAKGRATLPEEVRREFGLEG